MKLDFYHSPVKLYFDMSKSVVKIKSLKSINYNVLQLVTEKPADYSFELGQATEISINQDDWKDKKRPFTFTNLPTDNDLQFTIKIYPSHDGVTEQLSQLKVGDELILRDVFGTIKFKGKGTFLAGGAGVTPFIAIFKWLDYNDKINEASLIFANKKEKDIFLKTKFENLLGRRFMNILSEENTNDYPTARIDKDFLKSTVTDFTQYFYVCGPPEMTDTVVEDLRILGAEDDKIIIEDYDG